MIPKKDGSWRPCADYRCLNLETSDKYPLPNMQDLSNGLHGCTIFFKNRSWQGLSPNSYRDWGHSSIFAKGEHFNFGQITNHLSLPFLNTWLEMFPQVIFAQLFSSKSGKHFWSLSQCCLSRDARLPSIISSRFVLRGLSSDVTAWACRCLACQRGKIHRHTRLVPLPIPIPQRRFSHQHVDLVAHCSTVTILTIFLPLLIVRPSGWKPSPF